ncbi:hypothetical protein [Paenibacillus paridis]|uniref:hypothetical protein n=1 Tax=Paenibacillus paridis TaxID=2583376 RepID=UPI001122368C|nr:hypothetical protein [Paenibacillus paridis]
MKKIGVAVAILIVLSACSKDGHHEPQAPLLSLASTELPERKGFVTPTSDPPPLIQFRDFLDKDEETLDRLFDKPAVERSRDVDMTEQTEAQAYDTKAGIVTVTFAKGKAKQLSIALVHDFAYPEDAMKAMASIGLSGGYLDLAADHPTEEYMSFKEVEGFFLVNLRSGMPRDPERISRIEAIIERASK